MQTLLGSRIALTPRPVRRVEAALEVAMLGHCPGRSRTARLLASPSALADMRAAGFSTTVDRLQAGERADLYHVPVPLCAAAEFHDIFPDAATAASGYASILAGDRAWLAQAVDDFFANGGEKLWVIRLPDHDPSPREVFLASQDSRLQHPDGLRGLDVVLAMPSVGLVAFPDLERLQIPARLPDIPRVRLENPMPRFLPCGSELDDDHRERRHSHELPVSSPPLALERVLGGIVGPIARQRPDMQCLLTLPLAYSDTLDTPVLDPSAKTMLSGLRRNPDRGGQALRHLQCLFPYLRGPRFRLRSPVGVVAGLQSHVAGSVGPWRSMASRAMATDALPWPRLDQATLVGLRDDPGIALLRERNGMVSLDDERLIVPALPQSDLNGRVPSRLDGYRSGEIMRFLGFLRRHLRALGERLVFDSDPQDPRPQRLLEEFLRKLHARGALRGGLAQDAFRVRRQPAAEGVLLFEIEIAPAFPIDRLTLTFVHRGVDWHLEVAGV